MQRQIAQRKLGHYDSLLGLRHFFYIKTIAYFFISHCIEMNTSTDVIPQSDNTGRLEPFPVASTPDTERILSTVDENLSNVEYPVGAASRLPIQSFPSGSRSHIVAKISQADAQAHDKDIIDARQVLETSKDWLGMIRQHEIEMETTFNAAEFHEFYTRDNDLQDQLALNYDESLDERVRFAHSLFALFKETAKDSLKLQSIHLQVNDIRKSGRTNSDHSKIPFYQRLRALVMKVRKRPFVGGRSFQALMTSFVISDDRRKETWGCWSDMMPYAFITQALFANLLMYTHMLVEAFTPFNSISSSNAKATFYVKLGSPIYKRWLEPMYADDFEEKPWRNRDARAALTRYFLKVDATEMEALNVIRYNETRDRALNKKKLDLASWAQGVKAVLHGITTFEGKFPQWPYNSVGEKPTDAEQTKYFWDIVIATLFATGSRQSEVFHVTEFQLVPFSGDDASDTSLLYEGSLFEKWIIQVKNLAKQRFTKRIDAAQGGKGRMAPLLYLTSIQVVSYIGKIRWYLHNVYNIEFKSNDQIWISGSRSIKNMSQRISTKLAIYFSGAVNSSQDLRAIWANLTFDEYEPHEDRLMWIQKVLGHEDVGTAISYSNWWTKPLDIHEPKTKKFRSVTSTIKAKCKSDPKLDGLTEYQRNVIACYQRPVCRRRILGDDVVVLLNEASRALGASGYPSSYPNLRLLGFGSSSIQKWKNKSGY